MWQALYDSPLWLPILPSLMAVCVLVSARRGVFGQARSVQGFACGFALLAAADGWLGGPLSPLSAGGWSTASTVFFVIAGDFRYFLAARLGKLPLGRACTRALALSFLVPVASQLCIRVPFPHLSERILFLAYELGLLVVVLLDYRRGIRDRVSRALFRFEMVQYALWVAADLLLLAKIDAGYGLRVLPNLLYYTAFVPFAAWTLRSRAGFSATPAEID